jgi:hypothetical protein
MTGSITDGSLTALKRIFASMSNQARRREQAEASYAGVGGRLRSSEAAGSVLLAAGVR